MTTKVFSTIREARFLAERLSTMSGAWVVVELGSHDYGAFGVWNESRITIDPTQEWYRVLARYENGSESQGE